MEEVSDLVRSIIFSLIPVVSIIGGLTIAGLSMYRKSRLKELALRERIALIEKGIVPPPEVDPARFDDLWSDRLASPACARHRTAGIVLIGIGLALMVLIAFAGESPNSGVGVGGAFAILGLAFLVNSYLCGDTARGARVGRGPAVPASPREEATRKDL